jgi:hypothetical protein
MVPCGLDLEVERSHVVDKAGMHKVVRIGTGLGAVSGCAVKEARNGAHGLEESRHTEVVE